MCKCVGHCVAAGNIIAATVVVAVAAITLAAGKRKCCSVWQIWDMDVFRALGV